MNKIKELELTFDGRPVTVTAVVEDGYISLKYGYYEDVDDVDLTDAELDAISDDQDQLAMAWAGM